MHKYLNAVGRDVDWVTGSYVKKIVFELVANASLV